MKHPATAQHPVPAPLILALDCACSALSVALMRGPAVLAQHYEARSQQQAARLAPVVQDALREAGVKPADLDMIGVTVGPGSFTGIRIGLAFAAMAGLRLKVPALALSRLEAQAEKAGGPALASLPGWKGEVYHRAFRRTKRGPVASGPAGWCAPDEWPALAAAARSRGLTVVEGDCAAADLLPVLERRLAARDLPPFEPFYLKPAGYEKPRR
jgi:tRNA threonylcarbamoyladenosine biosynthesis protein TsaB